MRNNQPATKTEYKIAADAAIVSHTDRKGVIKFCNQEFIDASGFEQHELIGQPHNIVRHPDIPEEAFRDMWDTLEKGRPWAGIVKNRRKNGDFYWVKATATPLADGSGYMSVRVKASDSEIRAADALYARMRADKSIRLREGRLDDGGIFSRFGNWYANFSIATKIYGLTAIGVGLFLAAIFTGEQYKELLIEGAVIGVALLLTMAFVTTRQITNTVEAVSDFAKGIAAGNLTQPLPAASHDELGNMIARLALMRNNLHELIATIRSNVVRLTASTADLNTVANETQQSADSQSELASAMAAAIEQLSVSVDQIGDHASETHMASEDSGNKATTGAEVIRSAANEMRQIAGAVNDTSDSVRELSNLSTEISMVVSVIRDIADQTNLLALNAAIEAARAGESGRGFAVVADEVRKLAERTAHSTKDITDMISRIQLATTGAADEMTIVVSRVGGGVTLADDAAHSIEGIFDSAQNVLAAVEGINFSLREQSSATREIAVQVENIACSSESNAARAGVIKRTVNEMHELASELDSQAANFKIT
jgi:aerotaxis receptor